MNPLSLSAFPHAPASEHEGQRDYTPYEDSVDQAMTGQPGESTAVLVDPGKRPV